jgi:hypothetical protein
MTIAKQAHERDRRAKQREKEGSRVQRKDEKAAHVRPDNAADPDLAGMKPGPQGKPLIDKRLCLDGWMHAVWHPDPVRACS